MGTSGMSRMESRTEEGVMVERFTVAGGGGGGGMDPGVWGLGIWCRRRGN